MFGRKQPEEIPGNAGWKQVPPAPQDQLSQDERQRRATQAIRQSLAFAQIVSLLMQSPLYRHYAIADLEWLVIPPLAWGMFALAEARPRVDGPAFPVAFALWASVSADIDSRLSENLTAPIRLRPDEWKSGDVKWVIAALGDPRALSGLLQQIGQSAAPGQEVKIRSTGADGRLTVKTLGPGN